jgi:threonyl-tRNA synthetase
MTDSIGRSWQLGTVQLDYYMPERFELTYTGADNAEHRPVMIHRALLGSFERFIGILIEHYAGAFPVWLSPVQAVVIPVADRHLDYAHEVKETLDARGLRVEVDDSQNSMQKKIRENSRQKIPYLLIVGDREAEEGTVNVRRRGEKQQEETALGDFAESVLEEVRSHA